MFRNYRTLMAREPAWQNSSEYSVAIWKRRIIRWNRLIVRISPIFWFQPCCECFIQGLYLAWPLIYLTFSWQYVLIAYAIHVALWFINDYIQILIIEVIFNRFFGCLYLLIGYFQKGKFQYNLVWCIPVWFYREVIGFFLFMRGVLSRRVEWRSGVYYLRFGGCGVRIEDEKKKSSSNLRVGKTKSTKKSSTNNGVHRVNENMSICPNKVYSYSSSVRAALKPKNTSSKNVRTFSV